MEARIQQTVERFRAASPAVLPSLLMCDFGNLEREIRALEAAGAQALHLDVMDGHFVPNLTYGMPIVAACRKLTDLPLDVHVMISDPASYAQPMAEAGADLLTFHIEAVDDAQSVIEVIHQQGMAAGVALNPETPLERITPIASECEAVLVMSVQAGFGGQSFSPVAIEKLRRLREDHSELLLEVDGGVNLETIGSCREAGADLFVVGSGIFRHEDYGRAMSDLAAAMQSPRAAENG